MGTKLSISLEDAFHPEISPRTDRPPTFDPLYGFPNGRKPREMKVSWEEMDRWQLPNDQRDYCAHLLIPYLKCRHSHAPVAQYYCEDLLNRHINCQKEDHIMRLKEYEREKRLLKRKQRKAAAAFAAATESKTDL